MAKRAWYSRTTWTSADRDEVLAKLRSLTGAHEQASALRKQAGHLLTAAGRNPAEADQLLAGARELFELFLTWFPEGAERAYVLVALGEIEERAGQIEQALDHYRQAMVAQRGTPRSTNAHLRFGALVIAAARVAEYPEALRLLTEQAQPLIYPLDQYRHCGIRAHVLAQQGHANHAVLCARDALSATRHCAVDPTTPFHTLLIALANGPVTTPASDIQNLKPAT